jgi:predicted nucleic acid-binding protein
VILVDTSVWISHFRRENSAAVVKLRELGQQTPLLVGDYILLEVLQGARDEAHAARLERELRRLEVVSMLDPDMAARAAHNYRRLRALGLLSASWPISSLAHFASTMAVLCCMRTAISSRCTNISGCRSCRGDLVWSGLAGDEERSLRPRSPLPDRSA